MIQTLVGNAISCVESWIQHVVVADIKKVYTGNRILHTNLLIFNITY